ncbi:MAG: YidC/Oxa1 family insertase periplasmic-domain containing protein [Planctomyces sp.]|nr:YidC/Oxa1 family insertase periplasmic-domain containing protein [Planctomyces sp.]
MDNRRYFTLFLLFTAVWVLLAPRLFPDLFPKPKRPANLAQQDRDPQAAIAEAQPAGPEATGNIVEHPRRVVVLGPPGPMGDGALEYFLRVTTTSRGAAVVAAELLDPHYTTLDRQAPLKVVGNNHGGKGEDEVRRTLATSVPLIDAQLKAAGLSLSDVDWEVVPDSVSEGGVTYRYASPDGSLEVRKKYELKKGNVAVRDSEATGYLLGVDLTIENRGDAPRQTRYRMTGPVGLPLEDPDNARTFIELKAGTLDSSATEQDVTPVSLTASKVVDQLQKARDQNNPGLVTAWRLPLRYAGGDVQFFTALLAPRESQLRDADGDGRPDPYFTEARPFLVHEATPVERSDVALEFTSVDLNLAAGESTTHSFDLYLGPKRSDLLEAIGAEPVMNYGWWRVISRSLLAIMNFFHHRLGAPYWLAIILLTACVRGLMFPISLRQTAGAQKMKEIQPELQELRKKYTKEPEKFAIAQRDLFRKHNYNPLSGCLPIFLQLPIFIGLYNALFYAVDLRLARFLWIDNLAGPDALFRLPFALPLLNTRDFNLLPLITVGLFLVQQKLFMPPAMNEEQKLSNRLMTFMTVFMGFLFYKSPAGLCIYFIASSLWGIAERKLLDRLKPRIEARQAEKRKRDESKPRKKTLFDKLLEAADEAKKQTNGKPPAPRNGAASRDRTARFSAPAPSLWDRLRAWLGLSVQNRSGSST